MALDTLFPAYSVMPSVDIFAEEKKTEFEVSTQAEGFGFGSTQQVRPNLPPRSGFEDAKGFNAFGEKDPKFGKDGAGDRYNEQRFKENRRFSTPAAGNDVFGAGFQPDQAQEGFGSGGFGAIGEAKKEDKENDDVFGRKPGFGNERGGFGVERRGGHRNRDAFGADRRAGRTGGFQDGPRSSRVGFSSTAHPANYRGGFGASRSRPRNSEGGSTADGFGRQRGDGFGGPRSDGGGFGRDDGFQRKVGGFRGGKTSSGFGNN
ncbi:unnamed protein product [Bursaphelenchus xylophilus]|uniref:(pine wood nematode) hypothetical protein n=1 Tax=Bursaphelenchus xylophilus TaxID=6326 RepID=A0A1I7SC64_BURXY|nr:unnamed protein product [Bursaphelenchus xylophilus]CAG9094669.1 unnamed protein product [Bursaphelenchus xylophilus]